MLLILLTRGGQDALTVFIWHWIKYVRAEAGTCSAAGIAFSSPNECAQGGPTGGSTSPLIRQGEASAFMLRSNLLERASHFILSIPRSPAPDRWTAQFSPYLSLLLSFILSIFHSSSCQELQSWKTQTRDDRAEKMVRAANVVLITLFALAVVIYGRTLQMSSRSLFDVFSPQIVWGEKSRKKNSIRVKSSPPVDHDVFIMAWREVNMEDQMSSVEKHRSDLCFLSQQGLPPINEANKR